MLATGALRAVGVDAEVVLVDLQLGLVAEIRDDDDSGKGGVPAGLGIEGADPNQTMNSPLAPRGSRRPDRHSP